MSPDLIEFIKRLNCVETAQSCISLVNDIDNKFSNGIAILEESDWPLMASEIAKWKRSVMRDPVPSRIWQVMLKNGTQMTMVCGDENAITQEEAIFFARQRYFDDVLTVE